MVDVDSVSVCRCGERFSTEERLQAHASQPLAPLREESAEAQPQESPYDRVVSESRFSLVMPIPG